MEKLLRPYDKEFMRMAMLKHEETFKEQVYELHRLYRIQKTLMKSIGTSRAAINGSFHHGNIISRTRFDLEHPADADDDAEFIDESEIELTLGPTKYMSRKKHGTTSDSGPNSFSSSSTESASHLNNNNSRPSTSSMAKIQRDEFIGRELRLLQVTDTTMGYQNGSKNNVVELEKQFRQERLKHPWFFQVASMNMT
ncbi:hypothetical protein E1A91_A02G171500v1 [Gossypium mustelinum]|uniref:Uncharacterized protein n=1 Tax=Gossypium mustelinum TaxID=34275 RepID=A0A5D3A6B0_GOSMU|nr:hypothetical protein E1A91_A02G171500v1 [Gossypium mustelinum]